MTIPTTTRSPVHHLLEAHQPTWGSLGGAPVVLNFQSREVEQAALGTLGLCDLSGLAKLGIKGNDAERWLAEQGIQTPGTIYRSERLPDGGIVIRVAGDEFMLESGLTNQTVPQLAGRPATTTGRVDAVPRQDATFLLVGSKAIDVLAQTSGINFRKEEDQRLILTRLAGTSCGVFPEQIDQVQAYRLWVDPSYAVYLWETLAQICDDLGGVVVGAGCLFPELQ
jgi:glycine cleavage system aminomethyltransferase T